MGETLLAVGALVRLLTTVDAKMLFEVVLVLECFPTLQTFELPRLYALVRTDGTLG